MAPMGALLAGSLAHKLGAPAQEMTGRVFTKNG